MYIQQKLVVTSILTLCMLTVSFLLSSLTVLQNGKGSQLAASGLAQNNASALLIESMPESCENNRSPESKTCLRLNTTSTSDLVTSLLVEDGQATEGSALLVSNTDLHNVSSTRRQKNRLNSAREVGSLTKDEGVTRESVLTADRFDNLRTNTTTVAIMIPEPATTTEASEPIVTTVLNSNHKQVSDTSANPLETASLLACEMATRQHGLNGVCVELYRDNGDAIANPNDDQFIGFSLIMDDSTSNPDHYQFTNLPPGTYFAKFYAMTGSSAASSTVKESVESDMIAESESNTLIRANAIEEVSQERN